MAIGPIGGARSALQLAQRQLEASAHNTANLATEGFRRVGVDGTGRTARASQPGADPIADTVDRISATTLYQANLAVLAVDDELKGDLLDTLG